MKNENKNKSLLLPMLKASGIVLLVLIIFFFFLYHSREKWSPLWDMNPISIEVAFGLALSVGGIALTFLVYFRQTKSQNIESDLHKIRLEEIRKEVHAIKAFNSVDEVNKELQEWVAKKENSIFIFYFPFSIIPGFWLDGGSSFDQFLNKIEKRETPSNKYIFIGPKIENSLFGDVNQKIVKDKHKQIESRLDPENKETYLKGWQNLKQLCGNSTPNESLKVKYKVRLDRLKQIKSDNDATIEIIELNKTEALKLPLSSFVLKVADKANDLFYIDTFEYFNEDNNAKGIIKSIECIECDDFVDELFKILKEPKANTIRDNKITTLFLSSFLEAYCKEAPLNRIKEIIKNN